jgi:hypothetical protein
MPSIKLGTGSFGTGSEDQPSAPKICSSTCQELPFAHENLPLLRRNRGADQEDLLFAYKIRCLISTFGKRSLGAFLWRLTRLGSVLPAAAA